MPLENGNDTVDENKARRDGLASGEALVLAWLIAYKQRRDLADEYAQFLHQKTALEFVQSLGKDEG